MTTPQWIDSLLWRCRWYRRRVMKRSGVWTALMQKPLTLAELDHVHAEARHSASDFAWAAHAPTRPCNSWDTPAILTRGPRSFLEPRRVGSWPLVSACVDCENGHHFQSLGHAACTCPCHGKGAA